MAIRFEAYTADGILRGTVGPEGRLGDLLEAFDSIAVDAAVVTPFDGRPAAAPSRTEFATDDLLIVVAPASTPTAVHASWHELSLVAGPYSIEGLLPTLPGFDPARALARPTGTFVLLGSASLGLAGDPGAGRLEHPFVWVNRYTVETIRADIELGIFFPGAASVLVARSGRPDPEIAGPVGTAPSVASSPTT